MVTLSPGFAVQAMLDRLPCDDHVRFLPDQFNHCMARRAGDRGLILQSSTRHGRVFLRQFDLCHMLELFGRTGADMTRSRSVVRGNFAT